MTIHLLAAALFVKSAVAGRIEDRWWPVQVLPAAIVTVTNKESSDPRRRAIDMLLQSVAGLAAKAVNDSGGNEMVWIDNGNSDLRNWRTRMHALQLDVKKAGDAEPWELVERYARQGIVKGYILYRDGASKRENGGLNYSVNVATSLAGLLDGIVVEEELESEAKAHGLKSLMDVREKTQSWCFQTYKDQFNRRMLCTQDPRKSNVRDLAIAQKVFTVFGKDEVAPAMKWLEPLSPILGWNEGDEFETTDLSSSYGHIQTSTDWCINLPILMAGTEKLKLSKVTKMDPRTIDWKDSRSAVSFINTDGDNVQWLQGNFFSTGESLYYWSNPDRGKIQFGWSCCFAHLAQLCPEAIDYALATRSPNDGFIEWGGGYYYPDRFGMKRANRWDVLARHARRTWALMKETNTTMIGFNFARCDGADARKACEVFAHETDGLLAIFAFQYSAYEAGAGKIFWVRDRNGIEVPVITARYAIWEHLNHRERAGTPAKIAREIGQTVEKNASEQEPLYDWVIAHVWSYFKKAPGTDEDAENMPQQDSATHGGVRGYSPVLWCAERLPASVRVVRPDELAWRIRMKHNASQTTQVISEFK
jgi:GxGYxYP putative glycoside hydrolase C-terminal domain/GxGYxY sequence motif in domain of unknown function N-terminal